MADYISREAVLALETDLHFDGIEQLKYWRCHHIDPTKVKILPAADVRPVVRGEWKKAYGDHEAFGVRPFYRYCSKCHEATVHQYNFCPNCGADMRKSQALHEASQYADADVMMPST